VFKNVCVCYETNVSTELFLKKSSSLSLARCIDANLDNSKCIWSICMKFSGIMCLGMKYICGNFHCKKVRLSSRNVNDIIYVIPYMAHLNG